MTQKQYDQLTAQGLRPGRWQVSENARITKIEQLNGLSIKDADRMPHPADLAHWSGRYTIDADRGVFVVEQRSRTLSGAF